MKTDVANSQFGHFVLQHNKKGMPDTFFAFDQTWDFLGCGRELSSCNGIPI